MKIRNGVYNFFYNKKNWLRFVRLKNIQPKKTFHAEPSDLSCNFHEERKVFDVEKTTLLHAENGICLLFFVSYRFFTFTVCNRSVSDYNSLIIHILARKILLSFEKPFSFSENIFCQNIFSIFL